MYTPKFVAISISPNDHNTIDTMNRGKVLISPIMPKPTAYRTPAITILVRGLNLFVIFVTHIVNIITVKALMLISNPNFSEPWAKNL